MSAGAGTKHAPITSAIRGRRGPAILDAWARADALVQTDDVADALVRYEQERLGPTSESVYSSRGGGPGVIDAVEPPPRGGEFLPADA